MSTIVIGPFSPDAILGAFVGVLAIGVPLYIRYIWGSRAHLKIEPFSELEDSGWRNGRSQGKEVWRRRMMIKASNSGWADAVISNLRLTRVEFQNGATPSINEPGESIHKTRLEWHTEDGEITEIDLDKRTDFSGQVIGGRDDQILAFIPNILNGSELLDAMRNAHKGDFVFEITYEDRKGVSREKVSVSVDFEIAPLSR